MVEFKNDVIYVSSGDFFYYIEDVPHNPEFAICRESGDDYGYLTIVRKSDLKPREETWQWQQKQKYDDELRLLTSKSEENFDKLKDKLVDSALKSLASRLKFNALFGKDSSNMGWVGLVVDELNKLIKEKAEDTIKGKDKVEF